VIGVAKKAPTSSEGKAHQLYKQCPLGTVSYSEDYPSTPSTVTGEGWEIHQVIAGAAHAYWQGYIDLAGWSKQDLTMFTQAIDIQKSYLSRSSGAPTSLPIVKELDIITTRKLTEVEITTLATAPGYLGNTVDLQEVIYGLIRTLGENISIPRTYQVLDVETWGSGNPTAMDKLHWTRIIQLTIVGPGADLFIYPTNLIVAAVTMKEKDLVWMERLRRSYVLQGEL